MYAGTRQIYGRPDSLPVDETHLVRPTDINGINKAAGEYYHLVYNNVFGVRACSLRLTNVYGPRQLIRHNRQGFIGWFIRLALEGREIQIYGDGSQLRDFVYVDDAADAFLRAGASDAVQRRRRSMSAATSRSAIAISSTTADRRRPGAGRVRVRRVAAGEEGDRHRHLLRGLDEVQARRPAGARRVRSRDGPARARSPSTASTCDHYVDAGRRPRSARDARAHPVHVARAGRGRAGGREPRSIASIASGWFILGPEVEAFEAEFAAAMRRGARRRRRQRAPTRSR